MVGFSATVQQDQLLKREQLGALVSPTRSIQTLCLAEILLASLEILKTDRWADANKNPTGDVPKAETAPRSAGLLRRYAVEQPRRHRRWRDQAASFLPVPRFDFASLS